LQTHVVLQWNADQTGHRILHCFLQVSGRSMATFRSCRSVVTMDLSRFVLSPKQPAKGRSATVGKQTTDG